MLTKMGEYIVSSTCAQVECDEAGDIEKVKQAGLKMVGCRRPTMPRPR
ncbi:MAG: hypothetical protein HY856_01780 [Burkholderiales bacterium]|nr:hypothetical protein [Burkholderiales bacterium]